MKALIILALLLVPATAAAQELNCENPMSQVEYTGCAFRSYEETDAELNRIYGRAIARAKEMDADFQPGPVPLADLVRDAQRAWIPFRDAACSVEAGMARGGTAANQWFAECLEKLTRRRIDDLREVARQ